MNEFNLLHRVSEELGRGLTGADVESILNARTTSMATLGGPGHFMATYDAATIPIGEDQGHARVLFVGGLVLAVASKTRVRYPTSGVVAVHDRPAIVRRLGKCARSKCAACGRG